MVLGGGVSPGRAGLDRKCLLRESFSAPPRRRSGLWSRRRWFVGVLCSVSSASPARSLVMSSEATAQSRHLLGSAGVVQGCRCRGGLSTSGRAGPSGRDDVGSEGGALFLGRASPVRFWSCRAERTLKALPPSLALGQGEVESRHLHGCARSGRTRCFRGGLSAPPRRRSGLWSRRRWFVGGGLFLEARLPRPLLVVSSGAL